MWPLITVALLLLTAASAPVAVTVERGSYQPGEQVMIYVDTAGEGNYKHLWLYVDDPAGHNILFMHLPPPNGTAPSRWFISCPLPLDAPEGTYTVTVTWNHRYSQTGFVVEGQPIPEFPIAPLVLLVATAVAFLAISWRKTSARTKTPALDPGAYGVC